jgi:hypothetical protein
MRGHSRITILDGSSSAAIAVASGEASLQAFRVGIGAGSSERG